MTVTTSKQLYTANVRAPELYSIHEVVCQIEICSTTSDYNTNIHKRIKELRTWIQNKTNSKTNTGSRHYVERNSFEEENAEKRKRNQVLCTNTKKVNFIKIKSGKMKRLTQIKAKILPTLKSQLLLITTMSGVILGIGIGIALRSLKCPYGMPVEGSSCLITTADIAYLELPGILLINMLKLIILPLIMTSMIASLCRMSSETSGKLGGISILIFVITTVISVIIASIFALTIKPGSSEGTTNSTEDPGSGQALNTVLDIFRNIFPRSLVEAGFLSAVTKLEVVEKEINNGTHDLLVNVTIPQTNMTSNMNALGIITFSVTFGIILSRLGPRGKILRDLNDIVMDVIMTMVRIILWYSPIGICFLLLAKMIEIDDLVGLWSSLGLYIVADISASLVHILIAIPILTFIIIRENPFKYYYYFLQAVVTAFATASSGATLAVSFHCAEDKAKVDRRISRFVLPLGATVHMDGTAIYEMCSAIFLAQLYGVPLNAGKLVVAGIMSGLAAISSAGIPQGAIVNLVMVLGVIGVPSESIGILYATDWLLDRVRTSLNVLGDCLSCVVLQKFMIKDLTKLDLNEYEASELVAVSGSLELVISEDKTYATNDNIYS
ncbi:hypothetical protein GJ496_010854 [Pomphorhynchus laevis]|nr:hypothetical protein GJ496_010854 [Pomphorhynchus laevis]